MRGDPGLALIIAWKVAKATTLALAGVLLLLSLGRGVDRLVSGIGQALHVAPDQLSEWLTKRNLGASAVGLLGVSAFNVVEALGLHYRKRWAAWLTIVATASLVPLEIYRIALRPGPLRIGVLLVNAVIVWYLVRRVRTVDAAAHGI
jgi:uncharacterized membrane protein (DUF2068 family)